jgi:RNA polymerase sigma factor (sigma-70 family)
LKKYSDLEIVNGIRQRNAVILEYVYNEYYTMIRSLVIENKGNEQDAKDVFQEGLVIVFRKIKNKSFELKSSFKTYFYSVCWYIWLKELEKTQVNIEKLTEYMYFENIPDNLVDEYEMHDKYRIYQENFKKLKKDCQKILKLFMQKVPMKQIAKKLGKKSEQYIKNRKKICKDRLIENIKKDKRYKRYYEDEDK